MEGSVPNESRAVRTTRDVLRTHQQSRDLPDDDERNLPRPHHPRRRVDLPRRHSHLHDQLRGTSSYHPPCPRTHARTQALPLTGEMRLRTDSDRISRRDNLPRSRRDGPSQSRRGRSMADSHEQEGGAVVPRLHQLLSSVHSGILQPGARSVRWTHHSYGESRRNRPSLASITL